MKIADLFVKLGLKKEGFDKGIDSAKKKTNAFGSSMKKLGGIIAGAFAVGAIVRFSKIALEKYNIQAQAETQLLVALKGRKKAQQDLIKQAQQLQGTTLFGDEETIRAEALIAAFVKEKDQIKEIIPLVQDLATAKMMSLSGAADMVSKTLGSATNALKRYGIDVKGAVGSQERLTSLVKALSKAFKGQAAAAAKSGTGFITQFGNAWGDLEERIGGFFAKGLLPIINGFRKMITPSENVIKTLQNQQTEANLLAIKLTNVNLKEGDREKILKKLKDISPDIVKGLNAENISIVTLKDNLQKFNEEYVKKIALKSSKQLTKKAETKLGKQISIRLVGEDTLLKELNKIQKYVNKFDSVTGKQMKDILLSKDTYLSKAKKIFDLSQSYNDKSYKGEKKGLIFMQRAVYAKNKLIDAQNDELILNNKLKATEDAYYSTYLRVYGLKKGASVLSDSQRAEIDAYNKLTGASLDYSKALTKEQEAKLNSKKATGEIMQLYKAYEIELQNAQKELKKLKKSQIDTNDPKAVQAYSDAIEALESKITGLIGKLDDLKKAQENPAGSITPMAKYSGNVVTSQISPADLKMPDDFGSDFQNKLASILQIEQQFNEALNNQIKQGLSDAITSMAEGLGQLAAGEITGKEFGEKILQIVGQFMEKMGSLFIAYAIQMALIDLNIGNPAAWPIVLAAGIALVAVGAAISGMGKKGLSGGSSSAPMSQPSNYNASKQQNAFGNVVFQLEGTKLIGAIDNTNKMNNLIR